MHLPTLGAIILIQAWVPNPDNFIMFETTAGQKVYVVRQSIGHFYGDKSAQAMIASPNLRENIELIFDCNGTVTMIGMPSGMSSEPVGPESVMHDIQQKACSTYR